jgi:hypothetical protein
MDPGQQAEELVQAVGQVSFFADVHIWMPKVLSAFTSRCTLTACVGLAQGRKDRLAAESGSDHVRRFAVDHERDDASGSRGR